MSYYSNQQYRGRGAPRGRGGNWNHYDYQPGPSDFPNQYQPNNRGTSNISRGPRQRGGSTNSFSKPQPEKVIDAVPKPQHLSKAPSEEKNDPLYSEAFFTDESQALAPEPDLKEIHTGLGGLEVIARNLHGYRVSHSSGFAKRVPESALNYYCATYAYARMLDVQLANFRGLTFDEKEFVMKVKEMENQIPKALATVLAGIGNTTCPNGRELKFRMIPRNYMEGEYNDVNIPGYFGQAGPATEAIYKDYPCMAVFFQRILADIGGEEDWDLPEGIRPIDPNAVHPNPNLLGYRPSVALSSEQISFLSKTGITAHHAVFNNGTLPLHIPLLLAVSRELESVKGIELSPFPNVTVGSTGQIAFSNCLGPVLPGVDAEDQVLRCYSKLSNPVAFVASCAKYRSIYEQGEVVEDTIAVNWCIYDYVNEDIPAEYNDHVNDLRENERQLVDFILEGINPEERSRLIFCARPTSFLNLTTYPCFPEGSRMQILKGERLRGIFPAGAPDQS